MNEANMKVRGMDTYNEIYIKVRRALLNAGIEAPEFEARYIVAHGAGKTREEIIAMNNVYATDDSVRAKIEDSLQRRLKGEPLAYILGEWEFYSLNIIVNENVLIPRIDTEVLAEAAITLTRRKVWKTRVLDLCTGTGCIGLAIAKNIAGSYVVMADMGEEVLSVCRANAAALGLSRNTMVVEADALSAPPPLFGSFDIIVCNPPYIPTADIETLDSSVRDYEPLKALDGGEEGLDYYRAVTSLWTKSLKPGGNLLFECGIGQADAVQSIMKAAGYSNIKRIRDSAGIERVITGKIN